MNNDPRVFISAHELQALVAGGLLNEDDPLAVLPRPDQRHAIAHFRAMRAALVEKLLLDASRGCDSGDANDPDGGAAGAEDAGGDA